MTPKTTAPKTARTAAKVKPSKPPKVAARPPKAQPSPTAETAEKIAPKSPKGPSGKLGIVVALMQRPEGATVKQMGEATGWQSHSVRGALAGALKKKHGLIIISTGAEGGRVYRIAEVAPA